MLKCIVQIEGYWWGVHGGREEPLKGGIMITAKMFSAIKLEEAIGASEAKRGIGVVGVAVAYRSKG
jgi:hypothetical protein